MAKRRKMENVEGRSQRHLSPKLVLFLQTFHKAAFQQNSLESLLLVGWFPPITIMGHRWPYPLFLSFQEDSKGMTFPEVPVLLLSSFLRSLPLYPS